jgi:P-type E1-E2 ATPase
MAALANMIPNKCVVIRDGKEQKINATELVKGDLVRISIGDRIPADVRIIDTNDMKVGACHCHCVVAMLACLRATSY